MKLFDSSCRETYTRPATCPVFLASPSLAEPVWGPVSQDLPTLRVNISNLRKKLTFVVWEGSVKKVLQKLVAWSREEKYRRFWADNCDRRYMAEFAYPALSSWLSSREKPIVLEIGCRWYTARVRRLLAGNAALEHWCVDPGSAPLDLETDHFLRESFLGLEKNHPELIGSFDVVVSFGVLGYWPFTPPEVQAYLSTAHQLLKPDGVFLWKVDEVEMSQMESCYQFPWTDALQFFALDTLPGLPSTEVVEGNGERYHFRTMKKQG